MNVPNGILLFFGVLTITFGSWKDALFLGILVSNIAIGSFRRSAPSARSIGSPRWSRPKRSSCAMESTAACRWTGWWWGTSCGWRPVIRWWPTGGL